MSLTDKMIWALIPLNVFLIGGIIAASKLERRGVKKLHVALVVVALCALVFVAVGIWERIDRARKRRNPEEPPEDEGGETD